jgi:glycosyltransferase involved in cell wall biosynthesis
MMNKRKIIFSTSSLCIGGAEKFLVSLVNKLDYSKFECIIISYSENNPLAKKLNKEVELKVFPRNYKFDLKPLVKTREFIKNRNPDLLFCLGFFSFFLTHISTLLRFDKKRRIISYHTTIHRNRKDHQLMKFYSKFIRKTDKIISVCNNQINYTTNQFKIDRSYFTTIYNGVDTNYWRLPNSLDESLKIRNQYGIPPDAKVIIKTAAFRPEKNHKAAVDAFHLLNKNGMNNVFLLFVGDGNLKPEIENYVTTLNLNERIIFAGNQDNVQPFYWASNIFTLTSKGVETFSIAALEALNCGLPCVLTDIGGANEMIENGVNGYLTKTNFEDISEQWNKALLACFDKENISLSIKKKFSLDLMINNYEQLLN